MSTSAQFVVLTVIGDDKPGLVGELSAVVSAHEANWLESSMSRLGGKFAGIVRVEIPGDKLDALNAALAQLPGLKVSSEIGMDTDIIEGRELQLSLIGHDRIGIVKEVSQVLANHAVNVEELSTYTSSAPMSAEILFHAEALLFASPTLDVRALKLDLEKISDDLMVDIDLLETL